MAPLLKDRIKNSDQSNSYSQVPIKQVRPNKPVGWILYVKFIKIGPNKFNKGEGWKSKMRRAK
jgi:hypothetical protein